MSDLQLVPNLVYNFKYTPHTFFITFIFIMQFLTKQKDQKSNLDPDQMKKANKIFWKFLTVYQLSKGADWCLGPFVYEFFNKYQGLNVELIGKLIAISFASNLMMGPLLIGYLNDQKNKKVPCVLFGICLGLSCLIRTIRNSMPCLIFSQVLFGIASSILYSSFENWFVNEVHKEISDKEVRDFILTQAFEKSMIGDALTAVFVSLFAGVLKVVDLK